MGGGLRGKWVYVYGWNGESNGTPLQYSCLENPMDGGAWWAAVRGVAKSRTRLSDFTFTFHFPALEKEMETHSSVLAWRIPGMGEPGGLPSMGSHRVGHDWSDLAAAYGWKSPLFTETITILLTRYVVLVQLLCHVSFVTPWTITLQAPQTFTISWSLLKFMSIEPWSYEILQVRIMEWVGFPSPRDLSNPGIKPGSPEFTNIWVTHQGKP